MRELTGRFEVNVRFFFWGTVFFEIILHFSNGIKLSWDSVSKLIIWAESYFFEKTLSQWGTFLSQNQQRWVYHLLLQASLKAYLHFHTVFIRDHAKSWFPQWDKLLKAGQDAKRYIKRSDWRKITHYRSTKVNIYIDILLQRFPATWISAFMHIQGHISAKTCTPTIHPAGSRTGSPRDSTKILFL